MQPLQRCNSWQHRHQEHRVTNHQQLQQQHHYPQQITQHHPPPRQQQGRSGASLLLLLLVLPLLQDLRLRPLLLLLLLLLLQEADQMLFTITASSTRDRPLRGAGLQQYLMMGSSISIAVPVEARAPLTCGRGGPRHPWFLREALSGNPP